MSNKTFVTIMAGGIGSRFWPLSREKRPKQFLDLLGTGKSLLQITYERFEKEFNPEDIFIVTAAQYVDLVKKQLPKLNDAQILSEPRRKNTAPCIAYAAFKLNALHPNSTMIVSPADHLILEQDEFIATMKKGVDFVQKNDSLLTIGITPTKPHTGYGYIQFTKIDEEFKQVKTFTEKPSLEFARTFLESGEFLWNSGIFIWNTQRVLSSFEEYLPDVYDAFSEISYNTKHEEKEKEKAYSICPSISIDYGILEKEKNIFVLPSEFTWSDLGTWEALYEINEKDENENSRNNEKHIHLRNVKNSIVHSFENNKLIILQDVENLIVVDTEDALVVCNKSSEQKLKDIVNYLSTKNFDDYL